MWWWIIYSTGWLKTTFYTVLLGFVGDFHLQLLTELKMHDLQYRLKGDLQYWLVEDLVITPHTISYMQKLIIII